MLDSPLNVTERLGVGVGDGDTDGDGSIDGGGVDDGGGDGNGFGDAVGSADGNGSDDGIGSGVDTGTTGVGAISDGVPSAYATTNRALHINSAANINAKKFRFKPLPPNMSSSFNLDNYTILM